MRRPPESFDNPPIDGLRCECGHAAPSRICVASRRGQYRRRAGFTLVEILVAMAVTLIMLGLTITIFALVSTSVTNSRAGMEMSDQLRAAKHRLQLDLAGATARMMPPRRPELEEGYLEIIEGPVGRLPPWTRLVLDDRDPLPPVLGPDTTVGDNDDILMLTTRSQGEPFAGRFLNDMITSPVAEVAWFVRGTTLYRRQLLVRPDLRDSPNLPQQPFSGTSYYALFDVSARVAGGDAELGPAPGNLRLVPNSLGDLTKRENRFAHPRFDASVLPLYNWPHSIAGWGEFSSATPSQWNSMFPNPMPTRGRLGLPTLRECCDPNFPLPFGSLSQITLTSPGGATPNAEPFDAWENPNPWNEVDPNTGTLLLYNNFPNGPPRAAEDVILTGVLAFDIRVWDPDAPVIGYTGGTVSAALIPGDPGYDRALAELVKGAAGYALLARGAYVDLNYAQNVLADVMDDFGLDATQKQTDLPNLLNFSRFAFAGDPRSGLAPSPGSPDPFAPSVYDTWSTHYESDGIDQNLDGVVDSGTDGIDNNANGLIDEEAEQEAPPPYPVPVRGIQIKIRCFEADSQQIREVTIVQEFVPE